MPSPLTTVVLTAVFFHPHQISNLSYSVETEVTAKITTKMINVNLHSVASNIEDI